MTWSRSSCSYRTGLLVHLESPQPRGVFPICSFSLSSYNGFIDLIEISCVCIESRVNNNRGTNTDRLVEQLMAQQTALRAFLLALLQKKSEYMRYEDSLNAFIEGHYGAKVRLVKGRGVL